MKRKVASIFVIICLLFSVSSCAGQTSEQSLDSNQSSPNEKKWILEDTVLPSADDSLGKELPSGESRDILYMGLVGGSVYRFVRQFNEAGDVMGYHIQTLNAPYTAWETKTISLEGEQSIPLYTKYLTAFTTDGVLHCLYEEEGGCYLEKISLKEKYTRNSIAAEGLEQVLEDADKWYVQGGKNYIHTPDGLYCYERDFTAVRRTAAPDAMFIRQMTEKTLELATSIADTFLKDSIEQFNRQSEEYEIVLRERPSKATPGEASLQEFEDYCTKIQAEISGGGGPDLIDTEIISVENGAAKRYLRDLTEDFAEQRDQCEESIWQNGMVDGKLYSIPYAFVLESIVIPDKVVGNKESWTLKEVMQLTKESNAEVFGEYLNGLDVFWNLGIRMEGSSRLIDWENKVCHLNSQEAVELLEFSREYGDDRDFYEDLVAAAATGEGIQTGDRILRGEALVAKDITCSINALQHWETYFRLCDSVPVYIGFPTENEEAQHEMYVYSFSINQACKYPGAAVAFLQFLQSEKRQNVIAEQQETLLVIPVRRSTLEQILDKAMKGEYNSSGKTKIMGEEVKLEPVSQETVQKFWQMVETAKPRSKRTEPILTMLDEELAPYYAGDKSAEEVLDILQNRVQLYLNEID